MYDFHISILPKNRLIGDFYFTVTPVWNQGFKSKFNDFNHLTVIVK